MENPNATRAASAKDREAIQRGELGRTETWLGDKLMVEGDMGLLMRLEDLISEAWGEKWQPLDI